MIKKNTFFLVLLFLSYVDLVAQLLNYTSKNSLFLSRIIFWVCDPLLFMFRANLRTAGKGGTTFRFSHTSQFSQWCRRSRQWGKPPTSCKKKLCTVLTLQKILVSLNLKTNADKSAATATRLLKQDQWCGIWRLGISTFNILWAILTAEAFVSVSVQYSCFFSTRWTCVLKEWTDNASTLGKNVRHNARNVGIFGVQ